MRKIREKVMVVKKVYAKSIKNVVFKEIFDKSFFSSRSFVAKGKFMKPFNMFGQGIL